MTRSSGKRSPSRITAEGNGAPTFGEWLTRTLQQTATLALAIFGFLFCLLSSYSLSVDTPKLVLTAAIFVLLFSGIYSSKRRGVLALVVLILGFVWGWLQADALVQGLILLVQQAISPLSLALPEAMQALLTAHDAAQALLLSTQTLQAILFLTTLTAGYFIFCRYSAVGLALVTLPLLLPAPFYLLSPAIAPFFCLVTALLMVYVLNGIRYSAESSLPFSVSSRRRNDATSQLSMQHWLALAVLPLIGLVLLLSSIVLPEEGYERPESIENLQQEIFSLQLGKDSIFKSNDGLTHGDLRDLSSIRFTGAAALKIRTTQEQPMYLRDFAGASYSNDGWSIAPSSNYASIQDALLGIAPQNLCAAATSAASAKSNPFSLSVRNLAASKTSIWVPNGLVTTTSDIPNSVYIEDAALGFSKASAAKEYTLSALPIGSALSDIPLAGGATDADSLKNAYQSAAGWAVGLASANGSEAERVRSSANAYIDYVFQTYGTLPQDTAPAASQLVAKYGLSLKGDGGSLSLYDTCRALYLFLSERCVYAYSPPVTPAGVDFSTYFLEESRQGYCVHFATTATVLLRALGIPARYAEGYIVIPTDYEKERDADGYISIEDTHAHAWVEIFDPVQLEWIPVEMTASTGSNPNDMGQGESDEAADSPSPEPTPSAEPTPSTEPTAEPTAEPTSEPGASGEPTTSPDGASTPEPTESTEASTSESPEATPSPAPGGTETTSPDGESSSDAAGSDSSAKPQLWPLIVLVLAGGLTFAFFGLRKAAVKRLKRLFFQRDTNAAALALCGQALRLLRFGGCAPLDPLQHPEDYVEAAVKTLPWLDGAALLRVLELAQRARFSDKACPRAGRDEAVAFVRSLMKELPSRLPRVRRWLFRLRFPAF